MVIDAYKMLVIYQEMIDKYSDQIPRFRAKGDLDGVSDCRIKIDTIQECISLINKEINHE